jgi:hypothetical protein
MKKVLKRKKRAALLVMIQVSEATPNPYYLGKPNTAFYLPSGNTPSTIPNECIDWDHSTDPNCYCTNTPISAASMLIDPSMVPPSYWL